MERASVGGTQYLAESHQEDCAQEDHYEHLQGIEGATIQRDDHHECEVCVQQTGQLQTAAMS